MKKKFDMTYTQYVEHVTKGNVKFDKRNETPYDTKICKTRKEYNNQLRNHNLPTYQMMFGQKQGRKVNNWLRKYGLIILTITLQIIGWQIILK